ncbi:MAG TPA: integrase arm-type DNA-binding domain-containing protein [Steroidobacteraceae bacterium]|nr:integrase arm-type DNA-binding domain-containing protein [Steroidobacteraceae bacterium]
MLSPAAVAAAKAKGKAYKLADERGLYLLVGSEGSRRWRYDYRRPGSSKRNTLSLGIYPDVSLKLARERRDRAREQLADGIDPGAYRQATKAARADTVEAVTREWYGKNEPTWVATHSKKVIRRFERDVFPRLGSVPIGALRAPEVLSALRKIEARGHVETAHRICQTLSQVMRYAVATGRAETDVTASLRGALAPMQERHYAAITDPVQVGQLLLAIDGFSGSPIVGAALKLAPLLFVRPGELRHAQWSEIDLEAAQWNIPAARMKMRQAHLVPLATQAVAILRELQPLSGRGAYVFPGARSAKRPISDVTLNAALRRMGYDKHTMTGHGFRAMARTILDEQLKYRPDYIEHQLAHAVRDPLGRAYNRTAHLKERIAMMQGWADHLDLLREQARDKNRKVVPIRREAAARA